MEPSNRDVYFDSRSMVGPSWDFENSEIYKWLEENCKDEFSYTWGIELEDDRMLIHVEFAKEEHVKAFKEKFEILDWNMECHWSRMFDNSYSLFYNIEYEHDEYYDRAEDAIQWCRENTRGFWKCQEVVHSHSGVLFYFVEDGDATAFKLRFL